MANIHSAIKRNRSSKRRAVRNQAARSKARSAVKDARVAIASGEDAGKNVSAAASALDKAAEKGIIHKRNARLSALPVPAGRPPAQPPRGSRRGR